VSYDQQDYPAALADFSKAIELQPEDGINYRWRGRVSYAQQDYAAALADLSKAIELHPENGNNYHWRGKTLYYLKRYIVATDDFKRSLVHRKQPSRWDYYWLARTHFWRGQLVAAFAYFSTFLPRHISYITRRTAARLRTFAGRLRLPR
jgi:tetratricopeptide (TPR) repeat protein